jgi:TM2 domain-containing membrane protein YozV
MSILNLNVPAPGSESPGSVTEPAAAPKPKRAWIAFVLSLVVPGTGQIYAGRTTAGVVTLGFFVAGLGLSATLVTKPGNAVGDTGLGFAMALYIFAFLDAYFSTLEYNAGISSYLIGGNPRIAAILNFLTNGIGYFYLGERTKGLLMFVGLGIIGRQALQRLFPHSAFGTLAWITLQSVLAFDAYRLARKQVLTSFPELRGHSWKAASAGQLGPALPITVALVLCITLAGFVLLGSFGQTAGGIQGGQTVTTPEGAEYVNPAYGMKVPVPALWSAVVDGGELKLTSPEEDCKVLLLRQFTIVSPESYQRSVEAGVSRKEGFSVYDHRIGTLDGRRAAQMTIGVGPTVIETMTSARSGLNLYSLVTVARDDAEGCPSALLQVKQGLRFAR